MYAWIQLFSAKSYIAMIEQPAPEEAAKYSTRDNKVYRDIVRRIVFDYGKL